MAATRTLSEMRSRARQLSDMVGSTFVTDPEFNSIINEHCSGLYDLLVEVRGQAYYAATATISTVNGQEEYDLPTDFYEGVGKPMLYDGDDYYQMSTWEENERGRLLNLTNGGNTIWHCFSRYVADKIAILPTPKSSSWEIQLRYIPTFDRLVSDSDTFDFINGWERWVELSSAIEALIKEESFEMAAARGVELAKVEARIRRLAPNRDAASPPRIVDTAQDHSDYDHEDWDA